jgi:hypothetical protein
VPLDSKPLLWGSIALLVIGLAISLPIVFTHVMWIDELRVWIMEHSDKTNLDLLQYAHFLASAYVAVVILKGRETILLAPPLRPFVKCGQQALAVFLSGMVLSHIGGMVFDHLGTDAAVQLAVNGVSFALLFTIAYGVAWFKGTPWKRRAVELPVAPVPALAGAPSRPAEAARGGREPPYVLPVVP